MTRQHPFSPFSDAAVAWAAGLFEGEGCISWQRHRCVLEISMTDRDVLERFHYAIGGWGSIGNPEQREHGWKDRHRWHAGERSDVYATLEVLAPLLGDRRRRAAARAIELPPRDPLTLAWAAGLFEGEGCITSINRGTYTERQLKVSMTDHDVVARLHELVGGRLDAKRTRKDKPGELPQSHWCAGAWPDIERLLTAWLPFFGMRRHAAALAMLVNPALPQAPGQRRTAIVTPGSCGFDCPPASDRGRDRHRRRGTPMCERCWRASIAYKAERRVARQR